MKQWFYAFSMAWGMFLAIPNPFPKWDEAARERMLVCLPFVGVIVGGVWALAAWITGLIALPRAVAALLLAALPWLLTGFIHLDGFSDVCDAMLSRRDLPERQRILKDPHCGAFGVICLVLLILAQFAVFFSAEKTSAIHVDDPAMLMTMTGVSPDLLAKMLSKPAVGFRFGLIPRPRLAFLISIGLIPVAVRACAGLAVLSLRPMKTSQYSALGAAEAETAEPPELKTEGVADLSYRGKKKAKDEAAETDENAELGSEKRLLRRTKRVHILALSLILAAAVIAPAVLFGTLGLAPAAAALGYLLFAFIGYRNLGGMNGDISGFALTLGELIGAAVLIFVR
ncbi:MAG: adenosylcobinamide-GDP ribazoletransferase [Clostridia bacterium]|nr:adenosylcobinamide-GDP ribazoletransferase [Clostridia bacterium]